jgi:hypothetical protein
MTPAAWASGVHDAILLSRLKVKPKHKLSERLGLRQLVAISTVFVIRAFVVSSGQIS